VPDPGGASGTCRRKGVDNLSAAAPLHLRAASAIMRHRLVRSNRRACTYVAVGALNTAGYFATYNALRLVLGPLQANTISVALSISFSFWANRHFTFEQRGREELGRQFAAFSTMFIGTLILSNVALLLLFRLRSEPAVWLENMALIGSSSALLIVRYLLMQTIFLGRTPAGADSRRNATAAGPRKLPAA
jgi:putative flippase GtrA